MQSQVEQHEPLISPGVLVFGAIVIAIGLLWANHNYDAGMSGWAAFWPVVVASVIVLLTNAIAFLSPGGSILALLREIRQELKTPPILTAKEILAVMTPVTVLPPRDVLFTPYSKPLRIGRLLENGDFEMYCGESFVRYRFDDGAYVKLEQGGMFVRRIEFYATHWQCIPQ